MKIILDAMGGDNAPEAVVLGALDAVKEFDTEIILVGKGEEILAAMKKNGISDLPAGVAIANADDVVDMHDDPAAVLHKRKNSSMVVGLKMLAEGQGDAFVSAGSTGALLTAATLVVKRVKGIRRAAMAPAFPNKAGSKTIICDCGANAECTPEFLLQFAYMGSLYMKTQAGIEKPRVALINNGTEEGKGDTLRHQTSPPVFSKTHNRKANHLGATACSSCTSRQSVGGQFFHIDAYRRSEILELLLCSTKTLLILIRLE